MEDVGKLAHIIDPKCRCAPAKMWETERASECPAINLVFPGPEGEANADKMAREAQANGWDVRRDGPNRLYVDPNPGYRTHEDLTRKPSTSF